MVEFVLVILTLGDLDVYTDALGESCPGLAFRDERIQVWLNISVPEVRRLEILSSWGAMIVGD